MALSKATFLQAAAWTCIVAAGVCLAAPLVGLAWRKAVTVIVPDTVNTIDAAPLALTPGAPEIDAAPSDDVGLSGPTPTARIASLERTDQEEAPATAPENVAILRNASSPADVASSSNPSPLVQRATSAVERAATLDTTPRESKVVTNGVASPIARQPLEGPTAAFAERTLRRAEIAEGAPGDGLGRTAVDRAEFRRPEPAVEAAVKQGLAYVARMQNGDGGWSLRTAGEEQPCAMECRSAATGLAIMSFLGAGFDHLNGPYKTQLGAAITYLQSLQDENGFVAPGSENPQGPVLLYGHAIATIALCEAYGMTSDPQLQKPAQLAIDFIAQAQHPEMGGWRYRPGVNSDTSVSGWMLTALHSARLAGLKVSPQAVVSAEQWFELARASKERPYLFCYNPLASDAPAQVRGRDANAGMTAVGLLMRLYLGDSRDHSDLAQGAEFLLDQFADFAEEEDAYFWYYSTQVMLHVRGDLWKQWNQRLTPLLINRQIQDGALAGSWSPQSDRWGPHAGRLYTSTLNLLTLEVYYRHLPLYEVAWRK